MTIFGAIFLGLVQGITEFLPVSSSGHLVLFGALFGISADFVFFSVLLHLATLFAVLIVLWKDIKHLFFHPFSREAKMLYLATLPTVIIVLLFKGFFEGAFSGAYLPICFLITAILLVVTQLFAPKNSRPMTYKTSFIVGLAQGLAVLPGISRSGSTICTALLCGTDKKTASSFSFLLSLPIIIASMAYELFDAFVFAATPLALPVLPAILGFVAAFLSGLLCVKFMLTTFQKMRLWGFAIYLVIIALISLFII